MKTKCFAFCLKAKFIFIWSGSTVQRAELALEKDAIRAKTAWSGERLGMAEVGEGHGTAGKQRGEQSLGNTVCYMAFGTFVSTS